MPEWLRMFRFGVIWGRAQGFREGTAATIDALDHAFSVVDPQHPMTPADAREVIRLFREGIEGK